MILQHSRRIVRFLTVFGLLQLPVFIFLWNFRGDMFLSMTSM